MHYNSKKNLKQKKIEEALRKNLKKRKDFQNKISRENKKNDSTIR